MDASSLACARALRPRKLPMVVESSLTWLELVVQPEQRGDHRGVGRRLVFLAEVLQRVELDQRLLDRLDHTRAVGLVDLREVGADSR